MPLPVPLSILIACVMLAWTVPYGFAVHTYPIPTFYSEFSALTLYVLLAAVPLGMTVRQRHAREVPRAAGVPLTLGVLLLVQPLILPVTQPSMNWLGAGYLLAAVVATTTGFWISRMQATETVLRWSAYALLAGGLFAVFCQCVQMANLEGRFSPLVVMYRVAADRRPFGNMAQANHLSTYLMFAMAAAMMLVQARRLHPLPWLLLTAVYSAGAALTVSRTPWLQSGVVALAGLGMAWTGRCTPARRPGDAPTASVWPWLRPVLLLVVFVAVNAVVRWANLRYGWQLAESAADRFQDAGQISPRLSLWRYGLAMFRSDPWFGVGWGEFPHHQYLLADSLGKVEIANNSHDIFIDLLAKTGVVGSLIVWGGLAAWLLRAAWTRQTPYRLGAFTLLAVLGVHALVEYPQQYMFFLLPAALLIGMLDTRASRLIPARAASGVIGAAVLFLAVALVPVFRDYARAEVLYYGQHAERDYRADPAWLFKTWADYGLATLLPMDEHALAPKLAMHEQAVSLLPGETVLRRYAVLLAAAGREQDALAVVRKLRIFATAQRDWPQQLSAVYTLCDHYGATLAPFRAQLMTLYGPPAQTRGDGADDDSDDGDDAN
jgi:O-antigen ligase